MPHHCTLLNGLQEALIPESFKVLSTHQATGPRWPPAHPSETSVALPWWIHVPVLLSSDSLWCLIPSWLCPPSVRRAARPVMNIQRSAYLTGLSLLSKPLAMILQPQKTHSMNLLLSRFVFLSFLYSLSLSLSLSPSLPSVFGPMGFTKHIDRPDHWVPLLLLIHYWTGTQALHFFDCRNGMRFCTREFYYHHKHVFGRVCVWFFFVGWIVDLLAWQ